MRGVFYLALAAAIGYAGWWFFVRGGCGTKGAIACSDKALDEGVGVTLARAEACRGAGYVCVERTGAFQVLRWPLAQGKLKIRVAPPEFIADAAMARQIREAAIEGILEWDRRPFPLIIDKSKIAWPLWDVNVIWQQGGGGGHARMKADPDGKGIAFGIDGVAVMVSQAVSEREMLAMVKATAMHEMGHALGLMHSDRESDIMFPQFRMGTTPARPSDRDFLSVDALYALPNGAMIQ